MSAEAPRGAIPASARLGTGCLLADAGRRTVGARVASYAIYTLMAASAVKTL